MQRLRKFQRVLRRSDASLTIEVHGDLAGILTIALERKKPADGAGGVQFEMVAGTCSNQKLRTQKAAWKGRLVCAMVDRN